MTDLGPGPAVAEVPVPMTDGLPAARDREVFVAAGVRRHSDPGPAWSRCPAASPGRAG
jgi:hypothetical protein